MPQTHGTHVTQYKQQKRTDDGKRKVSSYHILLHRNRGQYRTYADDNHKIKDVGSQHIADSQRIVVGHRCRYRHCRFRQRRSDGYNGKSNDNGWNLQLLGNAGASFYKQIGAFYQENKTDDQTYNCQWQWTVGDKI